MKNTERTADSTRAASRVSLLNLAFSLIEVKAGLRTAYVRFDSRQCRACWKCVQVCPQGVFGKINIIIHKHAKIRHWARCTGCRKCVKACAFGAITPAPHRDLAQIGGKT